MKALLKLSDEEAVSNDEEWKGWSGVECARPACKPVVDFVNF